MYGADNDGKKTNKDGWFYVGLIVLVLVVVIGIGTAIYNERGGFGGPGAPDPAAIAADNLANPGLTDAAIVDWAQRIALTSTNINARTYNDQMNTIRPFFTNDGWQLFRNILRRFDVIEVMQRGNFDIRPSLAGPPEVFSKGVQGGSFNWRVRVPLRLDLVSPDREIERQLVAHFRIVRMPVRQFEDGIAIQSLNFLPVDTSGQAPAE